MGDICDPSEKLKWAFKVAISLTNGAIVAYIYWLAVYKEDPKLATGISVVILVVWVTLILLSYNRYRWMARMALGALIATSAFSFYVRLRVSVSENMAGEGILDRTPRWPETLSLTVCFVVAVAAAIFVSEIVPLLRMRLRLSCQEILSKAEDKRTHLNRKATRETIPVRSTEFYDIGQLEPVGMCIGRDSQLKRLDNAWKRPSTNIVVLNGFGGIGKSTLVGRWLARLAKKGKAKRVFAWTFGGRERREEASSDLFFDKALKRFGVSPTPKLSLGAKGQRLAELVQQNRTLLLLDRFELFQYGPESDKKGQVRDPALAVLISALAVYNPGLCIVTTKYPIADLLPFMNNTVIEIEVPGLQEDVGARLLSKAGVIGTDKELCDTSRKFGGHPLSLRLLGRCLVKDFEGNVLARDQVLLLREDEEQGCRMRQIMDSYANSFKGTLELSVLQLFGFFDGPATIDEMDRLIEQPRLSGITEILLCEKQPSIRRVLDNLVEARLLSGKWVHSTDRIYANPMVREYFAEHVCRQLPAAWQEGHRRLYEYHISRVFKYLADSVAEMEPLLAATQHGCQAGLCQKMLDEIFLPRIRRGEEEHFSVHKLGAWSADLSALSAFFDEPWQELKPSLKKEGKAYLLKEAGFDLWAVGRLIEAVKPMQLALEAYENMKDWERCAAVAGNLSAVLTMLGELGTARDYAGRSVNWADMSGSLHQKITRRATFGHVLHQMGSVVNAKKQFAESESLQMQGQEEQFLYAHAGSQYCLLLLDQAETLMLGGETSDAIDKTADVRVRAEQGLKLFSNVEYRWLTINDLAMDHLTLGQACLLQALCGATPNFGEATEHLGKAVEFFQGGGRESFLPFALLARAKLHRISSKPDDCEQDLSLALKIALRSRMRLIEADCHLEYGRLYSDIGKIDEAGESCRCARKIVEEVGYGRRARELEALITQIAKQEET